MITRHTNHLLDRLEQAYVTGCTVIRKSELVLWYGVERVTKRVWRDMLEKWNEVSDGSALLIGDCDSFWTIIYGKGLVVTTDSWFADVRTWADIEIEASVGVAT